MAKKTIYAPKETTTNLKPRPKKPTEPKKPKKETIAPKEKLLTLEELIAKGIIRGDKPKKKTVNKQEGKRVGTPKARPTKQERTEYGYMNDPDAPKYIIKDGYMVLKEKSQDISTPKARSKMQKKKQGGRIY